MGLLAIVDTFILFKIVEQRYSMTYALMAAIFFAIMLICCVNFSSISSLYSSLYQFIEIYIYILILKILDFTFIWN